MNQSSSRRWEEMVDTMEGNDPEGALYMLMSLAREGNSDAMAEIGIIYVTGPGAISIDVDSAMDWYSKAMSAGNLEGILGVSRLYLLGDGIRTNYVEARKNYEMIINELEDRRALFALGWIYHCGYGVDVDLEKAKDFYKRAMQAGHLIAPKWLASIYRQKRMFLRSFFIWLYSVVRIWWVALTDRKSMRLHRQL